MVRDVEWDRPQLCAFVTRVSNPLVVGRGRREVVMTMAIGASAHRRLFAGRLRFSFMLRKYIHNMGKQSEHHSLRILHLLSYVF